MNPPVPFHSFIKDDASMQTKLETRGLTSLAGRAESAWRTLRVENPHVCGSWRYYAYDHMSRMGIGWAKALDKMSRVDAVDLKEIYCQTAVHYVARLQGLKQLIVHLQIPACGISRSACTVNNRPHSPTEDIAMPVTTAAELLVSGGQHSIANVLAAAAKSGRTSPDELLAAVSRSLGRRTDDVFALPESELRRAIDIVQQARTEASSFYPFGTYPTAATPVIADPRIANGGLSYRVLIDVTVPVDNAGGTQSFTTAMTIRTQSALTPKDLRLRVNAILKSTNPDVNYVAELHLPAVRGRPASANIREVLEIYRGQ